MRQQANGSFRQPLPGPKRRIDTLYVCSRAPVCKFALVYAYVCARIAVRVETKVLMGYGRLTVRARHTYLMDFRRYAVGRAYSHANPAA